MVPQIMLDATRWILHKDKKPYNPFTRKPFKKAGGDQLPYTKLPELWAPYKTVEAHPSKGFVIGGEFVGLDLDHVINDKGEVEDWAAALVKRFNTFTEKSVRGHGLHLWFKGAVTVTVPQIKAFGQLEIYWRDRFFTITGDQWPDTPLELKDTSELQALLDDLTSDNLYKVFSGMGWVTTDPSADEWVGVRCPWTPDHGEDTGAKQAAFKLVGGEVTHFKCQHSHCADKTVKDVKAWTKLKFSKTIGPRTISPSGWVMRGGVIDSYDLGNIERAFTGVGIQLRWNAFRGRPEVRLSSDQPWGIRTDETDDDMRYLVHTRFGFLMGRESFNIMVSTVARKATHHHPVLEFLSTLKWDGIKRLDKWLINYGGAKDNLYVRAVSSMVLIAAVRRLRQPGVKFDELLILESKQGTNKSSALRMLSLNEDWFTDDFPLGMDAKEIIEVTNGKWLIEASELTGLNRKVESSKIKSFLSRQVDGPARMAYGHNAKEQPRQFVVIGTTNDSVSYLPDDTGNRRFWPVPIQRFDLDQLKTNLHQLWAEACDREAAGESIRLDPSLYALAAAEQEKRRIEDAWEVPLEELTAGRNFVQAAEVWHLFGGVTNRSKADTARVYKIMQNLGFVKEKRRFRNHPNPLAVFVRQGTLEAIGGELDADRIVTSADYGYEI